MNRNVKCFEQTMFVLEYSVMSKSVWSAVFWPWQSFCYLFTTLSIICCSKSAWKFVVRVCQVAVVVMETTQLVLSQF